MTLGYLNTDYNQYYVWHSFLTPYVCRQKADKLCARNHMPNSGAANESCNYNLEICKMTKNDVEIQKIDKTSSN